MASLVVVGNINIRWPIRGPMKHNTPLVVNADAMKTSPLSSQPLEPVTRRRPKVVETHGIIEHIELARGYLGQPGPGCPGS